MHINELKLRHREILIDLTYISLLDREPDPEGKKANIHRLLKNEDLDAMLSDFTSSEEFRIKTNSFFIEASENLSQATANAENADLRSLTPQARRIYADVNKAMKMKRKSFAR
jgi:hypothetical protein